MARPELMPHQVATADKFVKSGKRLCINLSETGTGKTYPPYEVARQLGLSRIIIFAQGQLLLAKEVAEAAKFGLRAKIIKTPKDYEEGYDVYVFSYAAMRSKASEVVYRLTKWVEMVILDESHNVKSGKAKQTIEMEKWLKLCSAEKIIMMTATPVRATAEDLVTQVWVGQERSTASALRRNLNWQMVWAGRQEVPKCVGWKDRGLVKRLLDPYMVRFTKEQVFGDSLPPMIHTTHHADISERRLQAMVEEKVCADKAGIKLAASEAALEAFFDEEGQGAGDDNPMIMRVVQATMECAGILKAQAIAEYTDGLAESEQVVVFANNHDVLYELSKNLTASHAVCHGGMQDAELGSRRDRFINGEVQVLVASYALSTGIDLICANRMIIAQQNFSPAIMEQAYNRIHRIGQTGQTFCDHVIGAGDTGLLKIESLLARNHARKRAQVDGTGMDGSLGDRRS